MIGAMPAVAVRHERRRQEKRSKRPSLLYLQSGQSRSQSPSPIQSPPGTYNPPSLEIYLIGKISLLHLAVITMLCGAVTLFIGLVQLKPGAEASQYRYILIGCGLGATLLGIAVAILRCCLLPIVARKRERRRDEYRKQQCAQYCVGHHCVHTTTTTMASATNTPDGQTKQTASNDQLADLEAANAVN